MAAARASRAFLVVGLTVAALLLLTSRAALGWAGYTASELSNTVAFLKLFATEESGLSSSWVGDGSPCNWRCVFCNADGVMVYFSYYCLPESSVLRMPDVPSSINASEVALVHFTYYWHTFRLEGTLPESWGQLSRLQLIDLPGAFDLGGTIPESWGGMTSLEKIRLIGDFTGTLPAWLGTLPHLHHIEFSDEARGANFSGPLPEFGANAGIMDCLILVNCNLDGTIPASYGNLSSMSMLNLGKNRFTGTLPDSMGQLPVLKDLSVSRNQLSGSLPASWGAMVQRSNFHADFYGNSFCGCLPDSWGNSTERYDVDAVLRSADCQSSNACQDSTGSATPPPATTTLPPMTTTLPPMTTAAPQPTTTTTTTTTPEPTIITLPPTAAPQTTTSAPQPTTTTTTTTTAPRPSGAAPLASAAVAAVTALALVASLL